MYFRPQQSLTGYHFHFLRSTLLLGSREFCDKSAVPPTAAAVEISRNSQRELPYTIG